MTILPPEVVTKAFVVREEVEKGGKKSWRQVSRRYHSRAAAESYRDLAEKEARKVGNTNRFYVGNIEGVDGVRGL